MSSTMPTESLVFSARVAQECQCRSAPNRSAILVDISPLEGGVRNVTAEHGVSVCLHVGKIVGVGHLVKRQSVQFVRRSSRVSRKTSGLLPGIGYPSPRRRCRLRLGRRSRAGALGWRVELPRPGVGHSRHGRPLRRPRSFPRESRMGAALSSIGMRRPLLSIRAVWLARPTIFPLCRTLPMGLSTVCCVYFIDDPKYPLQWLALGL